MSVLLLSFVAALCFPFPRRPVIASPVQPPLTAIVPVKHLDMHFEAAQSSLFAQRYPDIDILIATAEEQSAALDTARSVQGRYPGVVSRILISQGNIGVSPKLNNLWMAVAQARADLVLTK